MPNFRFHFHRDNQIFDENGDPISGSPGGGGVSNPLTEDLVTNAHGIVAGLGNGLALLANTDVLAEVDVAQLYLADGGSADVRGGGGAEGFPGGAVTITGGAGDGGNDPGASITVGGGDGTGDAGVVQIVGADASVVVGGSDETAGLFGVEALGAQIVTPGGVIYAGPEEVGAEGASSDVGLPGRSVVFRGGAGDGGNDAGASITVGGGDGAGTPGSVTIVGEELTFNGNPVGGSTHTYYGTTSVGGSLETMTDDRMLMKKITLASAGTLVSIGAAVQMTSGQVDSFYCGLWTDNAGLPDIVIGFGGVAAQHWYISTTTRWIDIAMGSYLAAGDYWIGVAPNSGSKLKIAYDASGSDRYYSPGGPYVSDASNMGGTPTDSTLIYSIRASVIR